MSKHKSDAIQFCAYAAMMAVFFVCMACATNGEDVKQPATASLVAKADVSPPLAPLGAKERAGLILGVLINGKAEPLSDAALKKTLDRFGVLSKGRVRQTDDVETKAAFFLGALAEWKRINEEQAVLTLAKAQFQQEYLKELQSQGP